MKKIDVTNKIFEIVSKYPDVIDIMSELGFSDITSPGMLNSVGRIMTLEKGARMKNISWEVIEKKFEEYGYLIDKEEIK